MGSRSDMAGLLDYLMAKGAAPAPDTEMPSGLPVSGGGGSPLLDAFINLQYGRLKDAVTAPRDAYSGDLQVFDPTTGHVSDEAMSRANGMAGLAMTGSLPMSRPSGSLGTFAGRLSKTADQDALARAESMLASGADRQAVWDQTGWFRGADGQMRYEIPDNASSVNPAAMAQKDVSIGGRIIPHREGVASEVMPHKELFAAYPDAAGMTVGQTNYGGGSVARYLEGGGLGPEMIGVESGYIGPNMHRPMLHEMQHAIQQREGFGRGGNPAAMGDKVPNPRYAAYESAATSDPHFQELQSKLKSSDYETELAASNKLFASEYEPRLDELDASVTGRNGYAKIQPQIDAVMREFETHSKSAFPTLARVEDLAKSLDARGIPTKKPSQTLTQDEAYRSLAGEVEARNVEARRNMTPEELRARPPWLTQDTPDAHQIVNLGMRLSR